MSTRIQIITIGNELLEGKTINTNASFLCKELYRVGYLPQSQISILDHPKTILKTFESSMKDFQVTICSGGLGPTLDDLTLGVACTLFDSKLELNQRLLKKLEQRLKHLNIPNLEQSCYVPKKATTFSNYVGMVPGYIFKKGRRFLILLPGVPYEFQHLVVKELIPLLKKEYPLQEMEYKKVLHLCRVPESAIAPYLEELQKKNTSVGFGVYPKLGILSIHIKYRAKTKALASAHIDPLIKALKKKYPGRFFSGRFDSIEEALHDLFIRKKWTISFAESCTGGSLTQHFTKLANASKYLTGSLVAYQNEVKKKQLGVLESTLKKEGAVSKECAKEMALGANRFFKTDFSIATTGIAGPSGGTLEKPVGTVWLAIARKNKILFTEKIQVRGSRSVVIQRTILYVLAEFWMMRDNL